MENWSVHHLYQEAKRNLNVEKAISLRKYSRSLIQKNIPVIFSLRHLAKITDTNYMYLRSTVERKFESSNYKMYAIQKRSGGRRFIHSVSGKLLTVQKYLNSEILQKIEPHPSSFAFHPCGGIKKCAAMHCNARWIFQFDLQNYFYSISEVDVYNIFKNMGYRPLLAFEFSRLCTTTRLPEHLTSLLYKHTSVRKKYKFYNNLSRKKGVLPQGAPTSPMLSNLVANDLDILLTEYSNKHGFVYTRYADDIAVSAIYLPKNISIGKIKYDITRIIRKCKFIENEKKTKISGPGSKKIILGLLVDGCSPRLSRETYKRIDRHIHASLKYGIIKTSEHEGFDSPVGFYNHLSGLVAYVKDVDYKRWCEFKSKMEKIDEPWIQ